MLRQRGVERPERLRLRLEALEPRVLLSAWSGAIIQDTTWSGTIEVTGNLTVNAGVKLTIEPGTVVKTSQGQYIRAYGTVDARGTEASPIILTSRRDDSVGDDVSGPGTATPARGDWEALYLNDGSDTSVLEHAEVRYAGNAFAPGDPHWWRPSVQLDDSDATLANVQVRDADSTGIRIHAGAPRLTNVRVVRARHDAFHGNLASRVTAVNLSAVDTGADRVALDGGTLPASRTWDAGGLPIELFGAVTSPAGTTLTIAPGQVIKLSNGLALLSPE